MSAMLKFLAEYLKAVRGPALTNSGNSIRLSSSVAGNMRHGATGI